MYRVKLSHRSRGQLSRAELYHEHEDFACNVTPPAHSRVLGPMIKGLVVAIFLLFSRSAPCPAQDESFYPVNDRHIVYHDVRVDASGRILPWYSDNPSQAYDHDIRLIWNFWIHMRKSPDAVPYYLQHQVWKADKDDPRGLGGDQINMALDSWNLLYDYLGDPAILENMVLMANYWLDHGMSSPTSLWPNLPFPYNTDVESGRYDGDMRAGKGFLQPDKAGSFGAELLMLYKKTDNTRYLNAAIGIANTLAARISPGDAKDSPWPFRVNAFTGKIAEQEKNGTSYTASYTTNWSPTLRLFDGLEELKRGHVEEYRRATRMVSVWLKKYPLRTNKWGPFFEDIPGWSDTQTNAITFAMFILQNQGLFPEWKNDVKGIFDWTYKELANREYEKYKVVVMNEQTVYRVPGNSHSSRQASVELMYTQLSGDTTYKTNAIRILNWATYTVANDGRNKYIRDDIWFTDGYGDYVRHYLRAMAAIPELAPSGKNRLLGTTSLVTSISYNSNAISYSTYGSATDILRLKSKPKGITCDGIMLKEKNDNSADGYNWKHMRSGGELVIQHMGKKLEISF